MEINELYSELEKVKGNNVIMYATVKEEEVTSAVMIASAYNYFFFPKSGFSTIPTKPNESYFLSQEQMSVVLKSLKVSSVSIVDESEEKWKNRRFSGQDEFIEKKMKLVERYLPISTITSESDSMRELIDKIVHNYSGWSIQEENIGQLEFFLYSDLLKSKGSDKLLTQTPVSRVDNYTYSIPVSVPDFNFNFNLKHFYNGTYSIDSIRDRESYSVKFSDIVEARKLGRFSYLDHFTVDYICNPENFRNKVNSIIETIERSGVNITETRIKDIIYLAAFSTPENEIINKYKEFFKIKLSSQEKILFNKNFNPNKLISYLDKKFEDEWYEDTDEDLDDENWNEDAPEYSHDLSELSSELEEFLAYYKEHGLDMTRDAYIDGIVASGHFLVDAYDEDSSIQKDFLYSNSDCSESYYYKGLKITIESDEGEIHETAMVSLTLTVLLTD